MLVFQETDPFTSVNMVMPGSLLPFKKEIGEIFRKEKSILLENRDMLKCLETSALNLFSLTEEALRIW